MAKPNFTLPNKPAIKSGSILSYNYTDDFTFVPAPLTFNRDSAATRVNEKGLIEDVGYFGPELVQNGDFSEIGEELIVNGDFSSSDISMITGAGARSEVNNELKIEENGLAFSQVMYKGILDSSKIYKATFDITLGTGSYEIHGTTQGAVSIYSSGSYTFYLKSTERFYVGSNGVGDVWYMDNVSIKEVGQNWTFGTGWSMGNGVVSLNAPTGNLDQILNATSGSKYRVTFTISNYVSGDIRWRFTGTSNENGTLRSANGTYTEEITLTNSQSVFRFPATGGVMDIDNISVIEVLGDKPRIDYSDSLTEPSLLLEPQSTNRLTYSEDFTQSIWTNARSSGATNQIIAPDGTATGYKLIDSTDNNTHLLYSTQTVTTSSVFAFSVFKKG